MAHPGGRPLKFETTEILQKAVDRYFVETSQEEWTITGLAVFLDTSRETLMEYSERPEFVDTVKRAKQKIEAEYERRGWKMTGPFAIFALKNFGWRDRSETDITSGGKEMQPISIQVVRPE